jgi:hypothetical protein
VATDDERDRRGFGDNYRRGLHDAASKNVSAYGYSVTITASFGLLTVIVGSPSAAEIFAFAGGAVLAVALVEAGASGGFRHRLQEERLLASPDRVAYTAIQPLRAVRLYIMVAQFESKTVVCHVSALQQEDHRDAYSSRPCLRTRPLRRGRRLPRPP